MTLLKSGNDRIKRGLSKEVTYILRVRETPSPHVQRDPSGSEREEVPGHNES